MTTSFHCSSLGMLHEGRCASFQFGSEVGSLDCLDCDGNCHRDGLAQLLLKFERLAAYHCRYSACGNASVKILRKLEERSGIEIMGKDVGQGLCRTRGMSAHAADSESPLALEVNRAERWRNRSRYRGLSAAIFPQWRHMINCRYVGRFVAIVRRFTVPQAHAARSWSLSADISLCR